MNVIIRRLIRIEFESKIIIHRARTSGCWCSTHVSPLACLPQATQTDVHSHHAKLSSELLSEKEEEKQSHQRDTISISTYNKHLLEETESFTDSSADRPILRRTNVSRPDSSPVYQRSRDTNGRSITPHLNLLL